jgi:methyltransferase-like protein/SAM-dependent methyltransferase
MRLFDWLGRLPTPDSKATFLNLPKNHAKPTMSQLLAERYDVVPFPSLPIARTQPDYLETIARLRGLQPAPAPRARVLELGCASGQNLIPLAERFPDASFVGVDLSGNQIAAARHVAAEIQLSNVAFLHQDLLTLDNQLGTFDYIIAHGVYSWVEEPVRDKLLAICRDHLAPHGMAYVSYKTYPGWRIHDMFRNLMLYDTRMATTPKDIMTRARLALDFIEKCVVGERSYEQLVQEELAPLLRQGDAYLWHDHLAPFSHPVLFEQFLEHAGNHGLQLAGDAILGIRPTDFINQETENELAVLTPNLIKREQYRDVLRNRSMRQTLLCRADAPLSPTMPADTLTGMYLSAAIRPESPVDLRSGEPSKFTTAAGLTVTTPLPLAKAALLVLGERFPAYVPTPALIEAAIERVQALGGQTSGPRDISRLQDNLMQCVLGNAVELHSNPAPFATTVSERPLGSPLARWQAPRSDVLTNRRHEAIACDLFDRYLLSLLDGNRTHADLIELLVQASESGQLVVTDDQRQPRSGNDARPVFATAVPATLHRLVLQALLVS